MNIEQPNIVCPISEFRFHNNLNVQCNLDLVTLNLVTTCDLVIILQRPFFNLLPKIIMQGPKLSLNQECTELVIVTDTLPADLFGVMGHFT